jgi:hypothetical protein
MMRKSSSLTLVALLAAWACEPTAGPRDTDVRIRVYNNSEFQFDSVSVNGVYFGAVARTSFSEYATFAEAYRYGAISAKVGGKWQYLIPIDYVGETPLEIGRYTYMISADPQADHLDLTLVAGEGLPSGQQMPGRIRETVRQYYSGLAGARVGDGGLVVTGSRMTIKWINPTISQDPRVIYLPNARVTATTVAAVMASLDAAGNVRWERNFGSPDVGGKTLEALSSLGDTAYLAVGKREVFEAPSGWRTQGWVMRTDASGVEIASRRIGSGTYDRLLGMSRTSDNGFILAGATGGSAWLVRLNAAGVEQWSRTFARDAAAESATQLSDGDYVLAGDRYGSIKVADGGWMTRTDSLGSERWTTRFGGSAESVVQATSGTLMVVGTTRNGQGQLIRINAEGVIQWQQTYAVRLRALVEVAGGGYALAGDQGGRFGLVRTDTAGNALWTQTYPAGDTNSGGADESAQAIVSMPDGGFFLVGNDGARLLVVRTDSSGAATWTRALGSG